MAILFVLLAMIVAGIGCRRQRSRTSLLIGVAGFGLATAAILLFLAARGFRDETAVLVYFAVVSGLLVLANGWLALRKRTRVRVETPRQTTIRPPLRSQHASSYAGTDLAPVETCETPR